jgi:hypothetical protein
VQDVIRHIHTLMPLQDAARAACISHTFLRSWRCYPNLTFTLETLGLDRSTATEDGLSRHFINKVEHILHNHAGIGVKALKLEVFHGSNVDLCYIDSWLHIAVTPGVEELTLVLPHDSKARYNFPCSLLFGRGGNSVQYLDLTDCTFRPTVDLGYMRRLTQLHLCYVWITGDELQLLLSKSLALERLRISAEHRPATSVRGHDGTATSVTSAEMTASTTTPTFTTTAITASMKHPQATTTTITHKSSRASLHLTHELGVYIRRMRSSAPTENSKNTINTKIVQLSLSVTP